MTSKDRKTSKRLGNRPGLRSKGRPPQTGASNSSDWCLAGDGVPTETITLSDDGQTYASTIKLATYDRTGTPIAGGGEGTGAGTRIVF